MAAIKPVVLWFTVTAVARATDFRPAVTPSTSVRVRFYADGVAHLECSFEVAEELASTDACIAAITPLIEARVRANMPHDIVVDTIEAAVGAAHPDGVTLTADIADILAEEIH